MNLQATGVLQDGSDIRPGVPFNPRVALRGVVGNSVEFDLLVVRPNGAPLDMTGGTLTWTIKSTFGDCCGQTVLQLTQDAGSQLRLGKATFTITPLMYRQRGVKGGRYSYDVVLVDADGNRNAVIPLSPFYIEDSNLRV